MSPPCVGLRLALFAALLSASACHKQTYVVVSVDTGDLVVPTDVRSIQISAGDPSTPDGGTPAYRSQEVFLCANGAPGGCVASPVTVSFSPGPSGSEAPVRVQVDALDSTGAVISSDATIFRFSEGQQEQISFVLRRACVNTRCAAQDRVCGPNGGCVTLAPSNGTTPPDLAAAASASGPPERIAEQMGVAISHAGTAVLEPVRGTQVGDRVVVFFSMELVPESLTSGWTKLGSFGDRAPPVFWRIAGEAESTNTQSYRFSVYNEQSFVWLYLVYRNAGAVTTTFESLASTSPTLHFPSVEIARPDSLLVSVGFGGSCPAPAFTAQTFDIYERVVTSGPTGDYAVTCDGPAGQLQYLIEPR